jgi:hypothetical protein
MSVCSHGAGDDYDQEQGSDDARDAVQDNHCHGCRRRGSAWVRGAARASTRATAYASSTPSGIGALRDTPPLYYPGGVARGSRAWGSEHLIGIWRSHGVDGILGKTGPIGEELTEIGGVAV